VITIWARAQGILHFCASARELPELAPAGMSSSAAGGGPSWASFPVYNADDQNSTGFPADVRRSPRPVLAADGVSVRDP